VVEALGNQLLAGAALADDQNRSVERRSSACPLDSVEERQALANEILGTGHGQELV
jgi:hypothetical protein